MRNIYDIQLVCNGNEVVQILVTNATNKELVRSYDNLPPNFNYDDYFNKFIKYDLFSFPESIYNLPEYVIYKDNEFQKVSDLIEVKHALDGNTLSTSYDNNHYIHVIIHDKALGTSAAVVKHINSLVKNNILPDVGII